MVTNQMSVIVFLALSCNVTASPADKGDVMFTRNNVVLDADNGEKIELQMGEAVVTQAWDRDRVKVATLLTCQTGWIAGTDVLPLRDADEFFSALLAKPRKSSETARLYLARAIARLQSKCLETAYSDVAKHLELEPQSSEGTLVEGIILGAQASEESAQSTAIMRHKMAIRAFDKAISLKPEWPEPRCYRGISYFFISELEEHSAAGTESESRAIGDFEASIQLGLPSVRVTRVYHMIGLLHWRRGEIKEAIGSYSQGLEIDSQFARLFHDRAVAHESNGSATQARRDYDEAIRLARQNEDTSKLDLQLAYYMRGKLQLDNGQTKAALEDLKTSVRLEPSDVDALNWIGIAHYRLKQDDEAVAHYTKAIQVDSKYATAFLNRAIVHQRLDDQDAALRDFGEAIRLALEQEDTSQLDVPRAFDEYVEACETFLFNVPEEGRGAMAQRVIDVATQAIEYCQSSCEKVEQAHLKHYHTARARSYLFLGRAEMAEDDLKFLRGVKTEGSESAAK